MTTLVTLQRWYSHTFPITQAAATLYPNLPPLHLHRQLGLHHISVRPSSSPPSLLAPISTGRNSLGCACVRTSMSVSVGLSSSTLFLCVSLGGAEAMPELRELVKLGLRHYCPLTPSLVSISLCPSLPLPVSLCLSLALCLSLPLFASLPLSGSSARLPRVEVVTL